MNSYNYNEQSSNFLLHMKNRKNNWFTSSINIKIKKKSKILPNWEFKIIEFWKLT